MNSVKVYFFGKCDELRRIHRSITLRHEWITKSHNDPQYGCLSIILTDDDRTSPDEIRKAYSLCENEWIRLGILKLKNCPVDVLLCGV